MFVGIVLLDTLSMDNKRHFYKRRNEQLVENSEKIKDRTS